MNRKTLAVLLVAGSALLGACSFSARTGHNYASEAGGIYTYAGAQSDDEKKAGTPAKTYAFKYAGLVNGKDVILGGEGFTTMVSCDKPCTAYNIYALAAPTTVSGTQTFHSPSEDAAKVTIPDLVFDDIQYSKLTVDPASAEAVKAAMAAPAPAP